MLSGELAKPELALGETVTYEGYHIDITDEMVDAVKKYLTIIRPFQIAAEAGVATLKIEERVSPSLSDNLKGELFGTADAIVYIPTAHMIHVIDFKYGKGVPVDVQNNPQLRYYGLGALAKFDIPDSKDWHVSLMIVQPRCPDDNGTYQHVEGLTAADLYQWGDKHLLPAIKRTKRKNPKTSAGEWCRFCSAKSICPSKKEEQRQMIDDAFSGDALLPNPHELTPEQLTEILTDGKKWLSACESLALDKAKNGETIPGFKLTHKLGNRRWISEKAFIAEFESVHGEDLFQRSLKTPAKLEKLLGKKVIADLTLIVVLAPLLNFLSGINIDMYSPSMPAITRYFDTTTIATKNTIIQRTIDCVLFS